jgi:hypothetical protein
MIYTLDSAIPPIKICQENEIKDKINIFTQFFIHPNKDRFKEILFCLKQNIQNPHIDKIYLLNERIYSINELGGIVSDKIIQVNINKRLTYAHVFNYISKNKINGFFCIINADIFFDDTLKQLHMTNLSNEKYIFAQLRFEYNNITKKSIIFGPYSLSQDTWIFHSNFIEIIIKYIRIFIFELGIPGCDNKILYLLNILGFQIINYPDFIKTHHFHSTQIRNYDKSKIIQKPYCLINPLNYTSIKNSNNVFNKLDNLSFYDNHILYDYIINKINKQHKFIIPRIAGVENNLAVLARYYNLSNNNNEKKKFLETINNEYFKKTMKNNAGIYFENINSIFNYSNMYLKSFEKCELYTGWEKNGDVFRYISYSQNYIQQEICKNMKMIWAFSLDIFHYIHFENPWTFALKGKKILLISAFNESLQKQILIRENIYGIDLFPECTFTLIKPPQTQGSQPSKDFYNEFQNFCKKLDLIKNDYDIALVSCGGYGNLVCDYIYENHNKSAIYIGGVLQMYFGILGNRWIRERSDIVNMYFNEKYWVRPLDSEKPLNYSSVEGSCYW